MASVDWKCRGLLQLAPLRYSVAIVVELFFVGHSGFRDVRKMLERKSKPLRVMFADSVPSIACKIRRLM